MDRAPYTAALRLYAVAVERWAEIDAEYIAVDLIRLPPSRFLNCVYAWCLKRIDPKEREEWDRMLVAPLPGQETAKPTEAQLEAEGQDFMALMAHQQQQTGKG